MNFTIFGAILSGSSLSPIFTQKKSQNLKIYNLIYSRGFSPLIYGISSSNLHVEASKLTSILNFGIKIESQSYNYQGMTYKSSMQFSSGSIAIHLCIFEDITDSCLYAKSEVQNLVVSSCIFIKSYRGILSYCNNNLISFCCFDSCYCDSGRDFYLTSKLKGEFSYFTSSFGDSISSGSQDDAGVFTGAVISVKYMNSSYSKAFDSSHMMLYHTTAKAQIKYIVAAHGFGARVLEYCDGTHNMETECCNFINNTVQLSVIYVSFLVTSLRNVAIFRNAGLPILSQSDIECYEVYTDGVSNVTNVLYNQPERQFYFNRIPAEGCVGSLFFTSSTKTGNSVLTSVLLLNLLINQLAE